MEYSRIPILPIPASIRRRLPRLYSAHKTVTELRSSGALCNGLSSSSEPHLALRSQPPEAVSMEAQRPSTASDDLDSFDSGSGGPNSPQLNGVESPARYETESGLRWNRVVPAFNLLRNAGYEAQQPQADGRLARSLYLSALMYLLDALPSDLTNEETIMLQHRLPESVKVSAAPSPHAGLTSPQDTANPKAPAPSKSYLHRILASVIVQVFLVVQFFMPYLKLFLRQVFEYERTHRITERFIAAMLGFADGLGKSGVNVGTAACQFNETRVGAAAGNLAAWWVEGVAGGIYEGVGEGMMHLGLLRPGIEMDRVAIHIDRR